MKYNLQNWAKINLLIRCISQVLVKQGKANQLFFPFPSPFLPLLLFPLLPPSLAPKFILGNIKLSSLYFTIIIVHSKSEFC